MTALASQLRDLASRVDRGELPPKALKRLQAALEADGICWQRDAQLRRLRELLDPAARLTDWAAATQIAARLAAFENGVGFQRIAAGYRQPKSDTERILLDLLRCPVPMRSAGGIWRVLRSIGGDENCRASLGTDSTTAGAAP